MIIFSIGIQTIEEELGKNTYERLKKEMKLITRGVKCFFEAQDENFQPLILSFDLIN